MNSFKTIETKIDGCAAKLEFQTYNVVGHICDFYVDIKIYRNDGITTDFDTGIEHWSAYKTLDDHMFVHLHDIPEVIEQRYPGHLQNAEWLYDANSDWTHMSETEFSDLVSTITYMIEKNLKEYRESVKQKFGVVSTEKSDDELSIVEIDETIDNLSVRINNLKDRKEQLKDQCMKEIEQALIQIEDKYMKSNKYVLADYRKNYIKKFFN